MARPRTYQLGDTILSTSPALSAMVPSSPEETGRHLGINQSRQNLAPCRCWAFLLECTDLVVSPTFSSDGTLFARTNDGVFGSTNGGESWEIVDALAGLEALTLALSPSYADDHTIYAGIGANGIRKSIDGGSSWFAVGAELAAADVYALSFSPDFVNDNAIYAGLGGGRLLKSTDGGNYWDESTELQRRPGRAGHLAGLWSGPRFVRQCCRQGRPSIRGSG